MKMVKVNGENGMEIKCLMRETLHLKLLKNCRIAGISTIQYNFLNYFKDGVQCPSGQKCDGDWIGCDYCG